LSWSLVGGSSSMIATRVAVFDTGQAFRWTDAGAASRLDYPVAPACGA